MAKVTFRNKQRTGNMGLFYTCYRLSRMGWNVLPTIRNAKSIDIVGYNENGDKTIKIQCKGSSNEQSIGPFKDKNDIIADFFIIINNVYEEPTAYILTKKDVRDNLTHNKVGYWIEKKDYLKKDEFKERWDKIGYGFSDFKESEKIQEIDKKLKEKCTEKHKN